MSRLIYTCLCGAMLLVSACSGSETDTVSANEAAPGAPGAPPTWSNAQKLAIGTSYEAYDENGQFSELSPTAPISKVWFSIGQDRITEVMWGLIHEAQIREIRILLVGPEGIVEPEEGTILVDGDALPKSPSPTLVQSYPEITATVQVTTFTDPDRDALLVNVESRDPLPKGYQLFAYIDPALGNTGSGDQAKIVDNGLHAEDGTAHLFAQWSADSPIIASTGYVGVSDGLEDLADGVLDDIYIAAQAPGNIGGVIALSASEGDLADSIAARVEGSLVIGFGETEEIARANTTAALEQPTTDVAQKYADQWADYLSSLSELPALANASGDAGALAYMSAINLKIMEDKTHAGALIASLSNPWGETAPADQPQTGYKAVWPRDFFQVASAFLAMGDAETALASYRYFPMVQVTEDTPGNSGVTGWFLQKTHVDGEIEWVAVQKDQTAMPIMLGWKLWRAGVISDAEMAESYEAMLKPAANFLVDGGRPDILWNTEFDASLGYTQQERWEEQEGYSPSSVAAVISGFVTAADLAEQFGEPGDAERYLEAADRLESSLEAWMFTTEGALGDGEYFIRITRNQDPNDKTPLGDNNGRPGLPEDQIVDGGFLELVRYGVRAWDAPSIVDSIEELDGDHEDNLRVRYEFGDGLVGWRRYGNDGYGEDGAGGTNYHELEGDSTPGQRGRVWPFFSGERAHYEIARLEALAEALGPDHADVAEAEQRVRLLILSMEAFANEGLSLPEQVWDGVGPNPFGYEFGEGTNSATPLAWTHAEYIKLLRSYVDRSVWDRYPVVEERFADRAANQINP
ncbi:MAG: glycoside hydrolase family 15 protein [Pseudomonadota bacterium]